MSKLDELIAELCPDGVEFVELNEVLDYEQPTKYIVRSTNYDDSYTIPVLTAGQSFVLGYTNEDFGIYQATPENPVIIFDDFTTSFHWVDFRFKVKSSAMKMLKPRNKGLVNFRFLFHTMKNINYTPADHTRQWIEKYSKFRIPLPPLPVQQEIVRILDNFTELTTQLTAELKAELEARKKQYEYYRDWLLSQEGLNKLCPDGVEYRKLGDIATISRGGNFQKKDYVPEGGVPCIHYGQIHTYYNLFVDKTISYISEETARKQKFAEPNDIVMAVTSENIDDVCKCIAWLGKGKIAVGGHTAIIHHLLNPKYLVYFLSSSLFYQQKVKLAHGTKVIEVTPDKLADVIIPVPPLPVQQEIVRILDNFTESTAELRVEVETELEARQKQYEYYRDKLLSFKEATA